MIPSKVKEKHTEYTRHRSYLNRLKASSLFCPRYDMLSLNNNLLLHRNFDPRKELVPKRESQGVRDVEAEIRRKTAYKFNVKGEGEGRDRGKWYEAVLRDQTVAEKKFQFQYFPAASRCDSVRESLKRLYGSGGRGRPCSRERRTGVSFYWPNGGRLQ